MNPRRARRALVATGSAAVAVSVMAIVPATAQTATGSVRFSSTYIEAGESADSVRVTVERSGALQLRRFQIDFDTQSGTARGGSDYTDLSGTLVFEVGESVRTFVVRIQNDEVAEPHEQFGIRLSNPRGDTPAVGAPATIAIRDDDVVAQDAALPDPTPPSAATTPGRRGVAPAATAGGPAAAGERATAAGSGRREPNASARKRQPSQVTKGRVSYRQAPVTPFELRASDAAAGAADQPAATTVSPLLALLAGLVLARVSAELWFRSRLDRL